VETADPGILEGQHARAKSELAEYAWAASKMLLQDESLLNASTVKTKWMTPYNPPNSE
jgi:hypothetical protein